ncbi:Leucine-rich repeat-containing protein 23 [Eumeta japonica]|uniref:Leucine-rich repeat-containing protein 23 n=1 Tax=Eumeta variegata TaxID=151549 RepID=A0A4C1UIJ4_EUMVA|nr:Leucine-rich repeat-containing protein 23 [Eumeta japonica]
MLRSHYDLRKTDDLEEVTKEVSELESEDVIEESAKIYKGPRRLHSSEISVRLSVLGKTAEGDSYAYLKATCTSMGLVDVTALIHFKHLQFVDLTDNALTSSSIQVLTKLPFLLLIQANKNLIDSPALKRMKFLQVIIMNNNKITSCNNVYQPELSTLEVGYNSIKDLYFNDPLPELKCLDVRYNLVCAITALEAPKLDSLYLAGNKIKSLIGISRLVNLRVLHLRFNPIKKLNGLEPSLTKLNYLNLRNCKVASKKQVKKLKLLPALQTLIIKGCPYMGGMGNEEVDQEPEEDSSLRVEVISIIPRLQRLNKGVVTEDERKEAKELFIQVLQEEENEEIEEEDEEIEEQDEEVVDEDSVEEAIF